MATKKTHKAKKQPKLSATKACAKKANKTFRKPKSSKVAAFRKKALNIAVNAGFSDNQIACLTKCIK